jgi:lysophospholipase L1-like esterase
MAARIVIGVGLVAIACAAVDAGDAPRAFKLASGDRVVLVGGGLIEQERTHGHLEAMLVSRHPQADIVVRNLGWGGDTVRGSARTAGYQHPDGLARLLKEVTDRKPTILFLGYGMNESFDGPDGLAGFVADYDKLLTQLGPLKATIVLLSPTYHEDLGRPLPDPVQHNRDLEGYTAAIQKLAVQHRVHFVDLFHALRAAKQADPTARLTSNGLLLTSTGYAAAAHAVADQLHLPAYDWHVEMDRTGKVNSATGTTIDKVAVADRMLRFHALATMLAMPPAGSAAGDRQVLRVTGLPAGDYLVTIDGEEVARPSAADLQNGITLAAGPAWRDLEKLRAAIVRTNELFYRRWRPFNDHSRHWGFMQGDYALYDKEIIEQDRVVAARRCPQPHEVVISAAGAKK